ncbi:hypothetical protein Tco_1452678, partial [Tanacetum coccineum]
MLLATPNWQTPMPSHPGTPNWQTHMPSHSATPNWQTPILSHPHDVGLVNLNILNRERKETHPSMYKRSPYMDLPRTTVLPKKGGDKTMNKGKNANVSPFNLGNAFVDDNVGADDVMFIGSRKSDNYFMYENVDPSKARRIYGVLGVSVTPLSNLFRLSYDGLFSSKDLLAKTSSAFVYGWLSFSGTAQHSALVVRG